MKKDDTLKEFLNIFWLRPENALWGAFQAHAISNMPHKITSPSLDLGAGNGLLTFTAFGGRLIPDYDFFINVGGLDTFFKGGDVYDSFTSKGIGSASLIKKKPTYIFDVALDHKKNLLKQAKFLGIYKKLITADGNKKWPFKADSFQSVFSNILYWLSEPHHSFHELNRVLKSGGRAFVFLQTTDFTKFCMSYHPEKYPGFEKTLSFLNRKRKESHVWQVTLADVKKLATQHGFKLIHHQYCYSKLFLMMWDIGLRPLSPVLIDMVNSFSKDKRRYYKEQWVQILYKALESVYKEEIRKPLQYGGYLFVILEKK